MDKNVMACELPEIVVSNYEELTYNIVKDICVDEGAPMIVTGQDVGCDKSPLRDVIATSGTVSKVPLTLGDIISLEDSQKTLNENNSNGERSFSESESGLAHITYSGPVSVSGSLSVRSDGSTVSAHSFAFPILQSEWNSSPVRMMKAEKRQIRKEKGWRHYSLLLCCRF